MKLLSKQESEKDLEARLAKETEKRGGMAIKLTSQFHRGLPDRLCLMPYHTIAFVELKSSGKKPTDLQVATMEKIRLLRFTVRVVDSTESLDDLLATLDKRLETQAAESADFRARRKAAVLEAKDRASADFVKQYRQEKTETILKKHYGEDA